MFIMDLGKLEKAIFLKRLNKFLGFANLRGSTIKVHIHDPGRLNKLLYEGNEILIKHVMKPYRKTMYDIVAARWNNSHMLVHSGYHGKIAKRIIKSNKLPINLCGEIRNEVLCKNSRIDFLVKRDDGKNIWIEVKGCTLIEDGVALFPDAPTRRGLKHVKELVEIVKEGDIGVLLILIFSKAKCFSPNARIDPDFSDAFWKALNYGVKVLPVTLHLKGTHIYFEGLIPLCGEGFTR